MMTNTLSSNKPFFFMLLVMSIMMAVSASSWIMLWVALEFNMVIFLFFIMSNQTKLLIEAAVKYLITQSTASIILLLTMLYNIKHHNNFMLIMSIMTIMLKLGLAPLHQWMIMVIKPLNLSKTLMLLTLQKFIPLLLINNLINMIYSPMLTVSLMNTMWGALAGLKQTNIQPLLMFSSINHMGWVLIIMNYSSPASMTYFMIYMMTLFMFMLSIKTWKNFKFMYSSNLLNSSSLMSMINLMSLGGLPPLLGFSAKWFGMNYISSAVLLTPMIISSMITLFFYLLISINTIMTPQSLKSSLSSTNYTMMILTNSTLALLIILT